MWQKILLKSYYNLNVDCQLDWRLVVLDKSNDMLNFEHYFKVFVSVSHLDSNFQIFFN